MAEQPNKRKRLTCDTVAADNEIAELAFLNDMPTATSESERLAEVDTDMVYIRVTSLTRLNLRGRCEVGAAVLGDNLAPVRDPQPQV